LKIHDRFYTAQLKPNSTNQYYSLPPIVLSSIIDFFIIAVRVDISQDKPQWRYGGRVFQVVTVSNSDLVLTRISNYYPIPLKQATVITLPNISDYYRIGIDFPKWFIDVQLEVWVYLENASLGTLDEKVNQLQEQLNRVEQKVDLISRL
jgi:hypothetical protein